ncbi:MAG: GldG family protein [Elusimicrobia bacterium]|nr:GldG family protein [Elusimicrobiota bacterium]
MLDGVRSRKLAFSWTGAALVLAILALLNVVAYFAYLRLDFSAGRIYSVSPGTRSILSSLKDNLLIRVYYSPRLPQPYGFNEVYLKSLLGEYKSAGRGKVKIEFLNPDEDERAKKEALTAGVSGVRLNVMGKDKLELREVMMGLVVLYKGKTETVPVLQNTPDFEYDITRKIRKLSLSRFKTAGFVTGHGEKSADDGALQPVFDGLRETMQVESVDLSKPVPAQVDALWLFGPTKPLAPQEIERLKSWVGSGRTLGILLDRRWVDFRAFYSSKLETGLDALLAAWGVDMREGFVADGQAERIQVEQQSGMFIMMNVLEYPYIPVITNMNKGHAATRGLDAVSMPFVHPIFFKDKGSGLRYTSLLDSSAASWHLMNTRVSPYEPLAGVDKAEKGPFSVAGFLEGDFYKATPSTAVATDAVVLGTAAASATAPAPADSPVSPQAPGERRTSAPGRVILVGTSRIIQQGLTIKPANLAFFLNLVEWSLADESLLSIRSKGVTYRYLRPLSTAGRLAAKNAMIFALPLALVAAGAAVYRGQKRRRSVIQATYGG